MLVKTPAIRIDVRVDSAQVTGEHLVLEGVAGFMPCEMRTSARELRAILRLVLKPGILLWLLGGRS